MKKILAFIGMVFLCVCTYCGAGVFVPVPAEAECSVYYSQAVAEGKATPSGEYVVQTVGSALGQVLKKHGEYTYVEVRFPGEKAAARQLLKDCGAKVKLTDEAAGITSYYCYVDGLRNNVSIDGETINLHVAVGGGRVIVGSPIIRTAY